MLHKSEYLQRAKGGEQHKVIDSMEYSVWGIGFFVGHYYCGRGQNPKKLCSKAGWCIFCSKCAKYSEWLGTWEGVPCVIMIISIIIIIIIIIIVLAIIVVVLLLSRNCRCWWLCSQAAVELNIKLFMGVSISRRQSIWWWNNTIIYENAL